MPARTLLATARATPHPALDCAARASPPPSHGSHGGALSATAQELAPFVTMAREAIEREYPVMLLLQLSSAADLGLPRDLTPAFRGSFDWHSAVHGHWCLGRAARLHPDADWASDARAALSRTLTREHLAAEAGFLARRAGRARPLGRRRPGRPRRAPGPRGGAARVGRAAARLAPRARGRAARVGRAAGPRME